MRPSTEDLLALRDGEPLEASARAAIEATPAHGREIERLRRMQSALRALPAFEAPPDVLERVFAAKDAKTVARGRWSRIAAGAGVAAVAAAAIVYVAATGSGRDVAPAVRVEGREPAAVRAVPGSYLALAEESARLERLLAELPAQQPLMTGETASTIAGLEDRIAFVDEQLAYGAARRLPARQQTALWSDRVELMNALVNVRYAEAQIAGY